MNWFSLGVAIFCFITMAFHLYVGNIIWAILMGFLAVINMFFAGDGVI